MGTAQQRVLVPWAVAVLLLALQLAGATHHTIHWSLAAPASVPVSVVSPLVRTGYHFQPPMNWINGTLATSLVKLE
jgi:beta-fructofuranosidase